MLRLHARNVLTLGALVATLGGISQTAEAQAKPAGFALGYTDIGPTLGLGNVGSANLAFGGRFERAIKALPDMGNGVLGINASFDYYSWSSLNSSVKVVPIGVTANYHFKMTDTRIDPFVGLGLGYEIVSCNFNGTGVDFCGNSAVYLIGRAGARYFFRPNMAAYADVGAGAATLSLGVMFKLQ